MMINSLLDNDFYKFTMMNAVFHQCPGTDVEYEFKCRNKAVFTKRFEKVLDAEIKHFCSLRFTDSDLYYLSKFSFFHKDFIDFLRLYQPNINHITTWVYEGELHIKIEGSWLLTILLEVPLLAMVNETYFKTKKVNLVEAKKRLRSKIDIAENSNFSFADFGTRRRFSFSWQNYVVENLSKVKGFVGTSNVYLARQFKLKPIGTQAHEWFMGFQGMNVKLENSQKKALQVWVDEYRGDLGIALTDTLGFDAFLKDFDKYFAKLYDGVRHDSGDPFDWGERMIEHYESFNIDANSKTLVFSDGLTFQKAAQLHDRFKGRIKTSFGIGTNLTNDFREITPLQIVIKMTECNGNPVAKISDSEGKGMCNDESFLSYLKSVIKEKVNENY